MSNPNISQTNLESQRSHFDRANDFEYALFQIKSLLFFVQQGLDNLHSDGENIEKIGSISVLTDLAKDIAESSSNH